MLDKRFKEMRFSRIRYSRKGLLFVFHAEKRKRFLKKHSGLMLFCIVYILVLTSCALQITKKTGTEGLPSREYEQPLGIVYSCALQTINELQWKIALAKETDNGKLIIAIVPKSWSTRAFKMKIFLKKQTNHKTKVDIEGVLKGQLLDWGRMEKEINNFYIRLDEKIDEEECIN